MKILYRYTDSINMKNRPYYFNKFKIFFHFLKVFKNNEIYVFADNVSDDTYIFLKKYINESNIFRTNLGNSKSFMFILDWAIKNFDDNHKVYFAEDDYIYTEDASSIIEEGLDIAHYSTGYDHPDKYINTCEGGCNPFISFGGEITRVLKTKNKHWKITNSTTMTFATKMCFIKEDYEIFKMHCLTEIPSDFLIFCNLYNKNRVLVSCIPAVSTHAETQYMAHFINWEKFFS